MTQLNNNKRLDESNGIAENEPNEAMHPASETTESPESPAKKGLLTRTRIGEKAIIAVVALLTTISAMAVHPVVAFIYGWAAGEAMSDAKQRLMNHYLNAKKATAKVNGAYWISNSYSYKGTVADGVESNPWAVWFLVPSYESVQVSQGHEVDDDPSGTRNGVAMSTEEAESYMEEQGWYAKIYFYGYAVNEDNHRVLVSVIARGDKFSEVKKETLAALRKERDDDTYEWGD